MTLSTQSRFFLSHFFAIILVSGSIGSYFFQSATESLSRNLRVRLQSSAALIAQTLDVSQLQTFQSPEDAARPDYEAQLQNLRDLLKSNQDLAFIYVMRRDEQNRVYFVLDSDMIPAKPGTEYQVRLPELLDGFWHPTADREITVDKWGSFLSGYAPLKGGEGRYLVGIDMRADEVAQKFEKLKLTGMMSLVFSMFLALVFSHLLSLSITRRITRLFQRCGEIAEQRLDETLKNRRGDELDKLIIAFDTMAEHLDQSRISRQQAHRALADANEHLEERVQQRTAELELLNSQLRREVDERRLVEQRLEEAARTDFLTGLLNRRAIVQLLSLEEQRFHRTASSFSLLLIDIDHFKQINDSYGHEVGDQVLGYLSKLLEDHSGSSAEVARWGGEEFLLLLRDTPIERSYHCAEALRRKIESSPFELPHQALNLRASLGVAEVRIGEDADSVINRADAALYRAKQEGRNRVVADGWEPKSAVVVEISP